MTTLKEDIELLKKTIKEHGVIVCAGLFTVFNCFYAIGTHEAQKQLALKEQKEQQAIFDAKYITQIEYDKLKHPEKYKLTPLTQEDKAQLHELKNGPAIDLDDLEQRTLMAGM